MKIFTEQSVGFDMKASDRTKRCMNLTLLCLVFAILVINVFVLTFGITPKDEPKANGGCTLFANALKSAMKIFTEQSVGFDMKASDRTKRCMNLILLCLVFAILVINMFVLTFGITPKDEPKANCTGTS